MADRLQFVVDWDVNDSKLDQFDAKLDAVTKRAVSNSNALADAMAKANAVKLDPSIADTISKVSTQSGKAANDTAKLAQASNQAADASKKLSAALETEAQKEARISAMVDESIRKLQERNRVAAADPTAASTSGFKVGMSVPRDREGEAAANKLQGLTSGGKIPGGILNDTKGLGDAANDVKRVEQEVEKLGSKTKISSGSLREMVVLLREAGRGDFSRMAGSASILAQRMGYLEALFNPITLGIAALTAGLVGYLVVVEHAQEATQHFNNMLSLTGNYAGLTANTYQSMAQRIEDSAGGSVSANEKLISSLASIHTLTASEMEQVVESSQRLAAATGQDADTIIQTFTKTIQDGPVAYAQAIADQYPNVIGPAMLAHIQLLEETGQTQEAMAVAIKAANDGIAANTNHMADGIAGAWHRAEAAASDYFNRLGRWLAGEETTDDKIADVRERINSIYASGMNHGEASQLKPLQDQLKALKKQKADDAKKNAQAAADQQDTQAAIAAQKALQQSADQYSDRDEKYRRAKLRDTQQLATLQRGIAAEQRQATAAQAAGDKATFNARMADAKALQTQYDQLNKRVHSKTYQDNQRKAYEPNAVKADKTTAKQANRQAQELARLRAQLEQVSDSTDRFNVSNALAAAGLSRTADTTSGVAKQIKDLVDQIQSATQVKKLAADTETLIEKTADLGKSNIDAALAEERHKLGLEDVSQASKATQDAYKKFKQALTDNAVATGIQSVKDQTDEWNQKLIDLTQNEEAATKAMLLHKLGITAISQATKDQAQAYNDALAAKTKYDAADASQKLGKKLDKDNLDLKKHDEQRDNPFDSALKTQLAQIDLQRKVLDDLLKKIPKGTAEWEQYNEKIQEWQKNATDDAKLDDQIQKADQLANIMEDVWANPEQAMKRYFEEFLDYIAKALIQSALLGKSLPGGGGVGGLLKSAVGSLFGGARAGGGSVDAGVPYLVGEGGMETFVPNVSGRILTNRTTQGMMGSNITLGNTTIVVQGGADQKTLQQLQAQQNAHQRQTISLVRDELARHDRIHSK